MKKVGIITFHRALNYGAILQTYALAKKIKLISSKDILVEIIDYRNDEIEKGRSLKERLKPISIKNILRVVMLYNKRRNFDFFIKKNISTSKKVYKKSNINEISDDYDLVITGSDQVWNYNITKNDFTYMLDFQMSKKGKCSYAASLGLNQIDSDIVNKFKSLLKVFGYISVRENECSKILKEILDIDVDGVHLDPTLLLTGDEWRQLTTMKKNKDKYILVYNVPKPDNLYDVANEISKMTGYKLIYIPTKVKPKKGKIVFPSISQFLTLFSNAEFVVTNSFHGTVFAIQFHKKLLVELKKGGTGNDRIKTLLKICDLEDRILDKNNYKKILDEIDWVHVDKNLSKSREDSFKYLKNITK